MPGQQTVALSGSLELEPAEVQRLSKMKKASRKEGLFFSLRRDDKNKNPIPIPISMRNILNNQYFTPEHQFTLKDGKLTVLMPISPNSRNRCEPHVHRLTISDRRRLEKQRKESRAEYYIRLLEQQDWTRAELARYLGVSRAWVSTVLNN